MSALYHVPLKSVKIWAKFVKIFAKSLDVICFKKWQAILFQFFGHVRGNLDKFWGNLAKNNA